VRTSVRANARLGADVTDPRWPNQRKVFYEIISPADISSDDCLGLFRLIRAAQSRGQSPAEGRG
jgi:hypothetical protein